MNTYITGATIKSLREAKGFTQNDLAERIGVSDKTVSKWETAKGLPDISLMEPLASALGVSISELISGQRVKNRNQSANMLRSKLYACPICGNIIQSTGEVVISCCGITLPPLETENTDNVHKLTIEQVEDEHFVNIDHPMTKEHYISFIAAVTGDRCQLVKLYPEGNAQCRFQLRGHGILYFYCNQHGLFKWRF